MDETELNKLLDDIYKLKPDQLEVVFKTFYEMFSDPFYSFRNKLPSTALEWRTKQICLLLKHRNDKKLPPRR